MTAEEYATEIVLPAMRNMLSNRGDRQACYSAVILATHLIDYIATDRGVKIKEIEERISSVARPSLEVMKGICNGTKHAKNRSGHIFDPGSDKKYLPFGFGAGCGGFGIGRWGHPGLGIEYNGKVTFIDHWAQFFVMVCKAGFPDSLGNIDINFFDNYVLSNPPPPFAQ